MNDEYYMQHAIKLAKKALKKGEVPVGALIVYENKIIATGYNCPISKNDPTAHAEIIALRKATKKLGNYRLPDTTLYVTLEPCIMCAGAIIHARIKRLVFGALDPKTGAAGGALNIFTGKGINHKVIVESNILENECAKILKDFFKTKRKEPSKHKLDKIH